MNEKNREKMLKQRADESSYDPAYPFHIKLKNKENEEPFRQDVSYGLTKREYFAAQALSTSSGGSSKAIAVQAVRVADALIEELAKEKSND